MKKKNINRKFKKILKIDVFFTEHNILRGIYSLYFK